MNGIRAVLLDLDGVLVDTSGWHFEALRRALAAVGCRLTHREHSAGFEGLPTRTKLQMLTAQGRLPKGMHAAVHGLKQAYTHEIIRSRTRLDPGKVAMLRRLGRDGYRLAICSNAIRSTVSLVVDRAGFGPHVEFCLSNEDVACPKPDPAIYRLAMARLNCRPDETVIVEDSPPGVTSARLSGARVLVVGSPAEVSYARLKAFLRPSHLPAPAMRVRRC